jgi:UDP-2,4-diacetamido-2,4,6-trideoxy-beta-L-altropyranose hydrolase
MICLCMLRLRPATHDDAMLLYRWQLDPETRRYARNPAAPTQEEHLRWFNHKLSDPDCMFLFAESDGQCVGMVRLDRRIQEWELSIIVAPESRGHGLGKAILGALNAPGPLIAEVLPGNEGSHRLFKSSGWRLCEDGFYRQ